MLLILSFLALPLSTCSLYMSRAIVVRDHTHWHSYRHTRYGSSGREIGPLWRPQPDITHHSQETDIHAPAGSEPSLPVSKQ